MTGREAERVAALIDRTVRPGGELPPVRDTDAVAAFDGLLRAAPRANRWALRALLRVPRPPELLVRLAAHCYYGDAGVMRRLGYDADAIVARAALLRAAEGRP